MARMTQNTPLTAQAPLAPEKPKPQIKLVAIDIDGTLLNSKSELTPRVEKAFKAALAQGVRFVLATGKTRGSMEWLLHELGDVPGIYNQGCVTVNGDGSVRSQQILDDKIVRQFITYAEDRGFVVALYSGGRILMRTRNTVIEDNMRHYREVAPEAVGALQNIIGTLPINKAIAMGEPRAVTALRWQMSLQVGKAARLVQAGVPEMVEILPPGASKGAALRKLAGELGIAPENILAIGDAENDIEMIQYAGLGVAMGHAHDPVKAAANEVVADHDHDGVAEALEKFVIVKPVEPPKPEEKPVAPPAEQPKSEDATADSAAESKPAPKAAAKTEKKADAPAKPEKAADETEEKDKPL